MQIDDILLLRMNRQYLFVPAEDELTVLRSLCGLQAQFYGNCISSHSMTCRSSSMTGAAIFCVRATQWKMTTSSPPRASASWPRSF